MNEKISIFKMIRECWQKRVTGALFLRLDDGKLLQIFFVSGQIKSIKCHGLKGFDVIKKLPYVTMVASKFHKGAVSKVENDLPETGRIIEMLRVGAFNNEQTGTKISSDTQQIIEDIFTEYVGPIANLLLSESLQDAKGISAMIDDLAGNIDMPEDQARFKDEVKQALNYE